MGSPCIDSHRLYQTRLLLVESVYAFSEVGSLNELDKDYLVVQRLGLGVAAVGLEQPSNPVGFVYGSGHICVFDLDLTVSHGPPRWLESVESIAIPLQDVDPGGILELQSISFLSFPQVFEPHTEFSELLLNLFCRTGNWQVEIYIVVTLYISLDHARLLAMQVF